MTPPKSQQAPSSSTTTTSLLLSSQSSSQSSLQKQQQLQLPNDFYEHVKKVRQGMQAVHDSGENLTYAWRYRQLKTLLQMILENQTELVQALYEDLGRNPTESLLTEIGLLEQEIVFALRHLKQWMKTVKVASPAVTMPSFSRIEMRPRAAPGCLIIGPFNFPILSLLSPAIGSLAAGNPTLLKPSELCPACSRLVQKLVDQYFGATTGNNTATATAAADGSTSPITTPIALSVVQGGVDETTALLQHSWGLVFFTGSPRVGTIIAKAAAENLTPTVLELGGKCPCYVDSVDTCPANLAQVANRIVYGKLLNAGQVCLAVDYLLLHETVVPKLVPELLAAMQRQYGTNIRQANRMGRIVSQQHAHRLFRLIQELEAIVAEQQEQQTSSSNDDSSSSSSSSVAMTTTKTTRTSILCGGSSLCDSTARYIEPTIVLNPPFHAGVLLDEIFGPILPIVVVKSRQEAVERIKSMSGGIPLALYVFTNSEAVFREMTQKCQSGSAVRNDVVVHFASPFLPMGGLGTSGYGHFHGKHSFDSFSHRLSVMYRPCSGAAGCDLWNARFHPFGPFKSKLVTSLPKYAPNVPVLHSTRTVLLPILIILVAYFSAAGRKFFARPLGLLLPWLATLFESMASFLRQQQSVLP